MSFSVAVCTRNRDESLKRAFRSILNQTVLPSEIIFVKTIDSGSQFFKRSSIKTKGKQIIITFVYLLSAENISISNSRNIALKICKNQNIIFVDDDVILSKEVFAKLIRIKSYFPNIFAITGQVVGISKSIFSKYMTYFHNQGVENQSKVQFVSAISNTAVLIDTIIQKKHNIWYTTGISSGEDTIFFGRFFDKGEKILYYPSIKINHDFFRGNIFNFFRRFFWYSSSMPKINSVNKDYYFEYWDYIPKRRLHLIFFPIFTLLRAIYLTKNTYQAKKITDRRLLFIEFIKNITYIIGTTYSKYSIK